jgi:hypothetical protein
MEQNSPVRGQFSNSCVSDVVDSIFNMLLKMQKCSQNSCSLGDERKLKHSILEDQTTQSKKERNERCCVEQITKVKAIPLQA